MGLRRYLNFARVASTIWLGIGLYAAFDGMLILPMLAAINMTIWQAADWVKR